MTIVFYHNPRCSKSRAVDALLTGRGLSVERVEYLRHPPGKSDLNRLLDALDQPPQALVRTGDAAFRELELNADDLDRDQVVDLLINHPALLQRPVVLVDDKAAIGRPIEQVERILP